MTTEIAHARPAAEPIHISERLGMAAAVFAVAALLLRVIRLDLSAFTWDEPRFLFAAVEQLDTSRWRAVSPLVGNQGLSYGPWTVWIESAVIGVFGPRPLSVIYAECLAMCSAHIALAWAVARVFRGGYWLFALVLGLLAASPSQFFWSRMAWDNPWLNVCAGWAVAMLSGKRLPRTPYFAVLGVVLGVAVGTHLMVFSFVAITFLMCAWEGREEPRSTIGKLALAALVCALINTPYLLYLKHLPVLPAHELPSFSWALAWEFFLQPVSILTAESARYFFDQDWPLFLSWLGIDGRLLPGTIVTYVFALLALSGLVLAWKGGDRLERRLALFAGATWIGHTMYCAWRHLEVHPHYQQPSYWAIPVGLAAFVVHAWRFAPRAASATRASVRDMFRVWAPRLISASFALIIALQIFFLVGWMVFIRQNGGTRGVHYGTTLRQQERAVVRACRTDATVLAFDNRTAVFDVAVQYLASVEPRCKGKEIVFCKGGRCPKHVGSIFTLEYAAERGGRLK